MAATPAEENGADDFMVRLTTHPWMIWVLRHVISPLDPLIFKATNGRFMSMGAPTMPMLTLTMRGRKSGKRRSVHLACIEHEGDWLIVASAMGQQKHPGWRYNLEANPEVEVQMHEDRFVARAEVLSDEEKGKVWDRIREIIPQIRVYESRTARNIRVFRLVRLREMSERTQR